MKKIFILYSVLCLSIAWAQDTYFDKGLKAFEQQKYQQADSFYTLYLKQHRSTNAYFNRASARLQLQKYHQAIEDFTIVINADKTDVEALYNRATAYIKVNDCNSASVDAQQALALQKDFYQAYIVLGLCHTQAQEFRLAQQAFDTALRIENKAILYYQKAESYLAEHKADSALTNYEKAIALEENSQFYLGKANLFYTEKKYKKALVAYEDALNLSPQNVNILYNKALVHYHLYEEKKAIVTLQELLQIQPTFIDAKWQMALCYYAQKDYEKSLYWYEQVKEQNPKYVHLNELNPKEIEGKIKIGKHLVLIALFVVLLLIFLFLLRKVMR